LSDKLVLDFVESHKFVPLLLTVAFERNIASCDSEVVGNCSQYPGLVVRGQGGESTDSFVHCQHIFLMAFAASKTLSSSFWRFIRWMAPAKSE
jgi:hypothetical protein